MPLRPKSTDERIAIHTDLATRLSLMDNDQITRLVEDIPEAANGWGSNGIVRLGRRKIFVKRIPVTDLEFENPYSTRNLHGLPTYYNYGIGSAGLGVYREILANIKTTNWVLDGSCTAFPMMHHHRIIPWTDRKGELDPERQREYVRYWNNSRAIAEYREARASTRHQALLFIEHIPAMLRDWLRQDLSRVARAIPPVLETLAFLRSKGVVHFDSHHWNILTDGRQHYLTDFGLVSDLAFHLSRQEKQFLRRNTYYDASEFLACAVGYVWGTFLEIPLPRRKAIAESCGLKGGETRWERRRAVTENIERPVAKGIVKLPKSFVDTVIRYRAIDSVHRAWEQRMVKGSRKHYRFDNDRIRRLLKETKR